jgi:fucose permease
MASYPHYLQRFIGAAVLKYCDPAYSLTVYALTCALLTLGITQASGQGIVACMFCKNGFASAV